MTEANEYLYSGSYDLTIKNWNVDDMKMRVKIRDQLRVEEEYSLKAETYNSVMDSKKKKKKRSKSPAKSSKKKTALPQKEQPEVPKVSKEQPIVSKVSKEQPQILKVSNPIPEVEEEQQAKQKKKK